MLTRVIPSTLALSLILSSPVQAELQLSTQTTTLPQPPTPTHIQSNTPPEQTLAQPLSLMGEQVLEAICTGDLQIETGLEIMPDLSRQHIQQVCPQRLPIKTAQR